MGIYANSCGFTSSFPLSVTFKLGEDMGNSLSLIMLAAWPAVAAMLFSRLTPRQALIWVPLLGYLLLPPVVGIDLPILPTLDKHAIPSLCAMLGAVMLRDRFPMPWIRLEGWVVILTVLTLLTTNLTVATNPEPLIEGITYRPGLGLVDALHGTINTVLTLLPFLLGYLVLSSTDGIRAWMVALTLATLAYSLPMLLEIRLSPQLNVWIYGFFAHDFGQTIRYGGFRPMVFLEHGLWVAVFVVMGVICAAVALRDGNTLARARNIAVLVYLMAVLVLCKSVASLIYATLLVPIVLMTPPRLQVSIAAVLAALVMAYPLALWLGVMPTDAIRDFAVSMDAERGQSLEFRFINEQVLLDRASQKPWAGWGGWGRNLEVDPISGRFTTVTDGYWIVVMTTNGILGYVSIFGLLCGSVFRLWLATRSGPVDRWTAGLALIMAANLVDLVPNATVTPLTWMSAGALAGLSARGMRVGARKATPAPAARRAMKTVIG